MADGSRDANGNGTVDRYEDWRLPVALRVDDLVSRMTLEEKAGLMLIDTMAPGCGGALSATATRLIETQKMTRFILRNVVKGTADPCDGSVTPARNGFMVTPRQMAATFTNAVQEKRESSTPGHSGALQGKRAQSLLIRMRAPASTGGRRVHRPSRKKRASPLRRSVQATCRWCKSPASVMGEEWKSDWAARHVRLHGGPLD